MRSSIILEPTMEENQAAENKDHVVDLTADVVSAYVSNNAVPVSELPALISQVFRMFSGLTDTDSDAAAGVQKPAVNPRRSVHDDHIVCLDCGKKLKSLRRHLANNHDMTPEQYRAKWGLERDYPMITSNYFEVRSKIAKKTGLGGNTKARQGGAPAKHDRKIKTTA